MLAAGPTVIGFDVEWKPSFVKGAPPNKAALVQLAYACRVGEHTLGPDQRVHACPYVTLGLVPAGVLTVVCKTSQNMACKATLN
jgi:hypothetical protein